jgi:hypothetical protein
MRRTVRSIAGAPGALLFAAVLLAAPLATPAAADPDAARTAITAQLAALADGDADAAYALAAPSIQKMFPTSARFIAMVKEGYAPIITAHDPVFLRARAMDDGRFAQEVGFTDAGGRSWTALYTLARQPSGEWRIDGCYLRRGESVGA